MNKIQELILQARTHVEITFGDPALTNDTLADLARTHFLLGRAMLEVEGWVQVPPELPKIAVKAKPRPQYPSDRNRKPTTVKSQKAAERKRVKGAEPRHVTAREVACPKCGAGVGEVCWRMTIGKNSKPLNVHTAHGSSHDERRALYTKTMIDIAAAKQNPDVRLPDDKVAEMYGAGLNGEIVDDPRGAPPTSVDIDSMTDEEILAALGERGI